jgi:hypothetical protein
MTFRILTLNIMTFRKIALSIKGLFTTLSINDTHYKDIWNNDTQHNDIENGSNHRGFFATLNIMAFSIMTSRKRTLRITLFRIMALSIKGLFAMTLSLTIFSTMTLRIMAF